SRDYLVTDPLLHLIQLNFLRSFRPNFQKIDQIVGGSLDGYGEQRAWWQFTIMFYMCSARFTWYLVFLEYFISKFIININIEYYLSLIMFIGSCVEAGYNFDIITQIVKQQKDMCMIPQILF
ncbi:hypothetical protein ACJX0J_006467, partial [Zea mays]